MDGDRRVTINKSPVPGEARQADGEVAMEKWLGENLRGGLVGGGSPARSRPMVWTNRRSGGQVAVRLGDFKVIRQGLNTGKPGPWEVYDLARDEDESVNLAGSRPELIDQPVAVLTSELGPGSAVPASKVSR